MSDSSVEGVLAAAQSIRDGPGYRVEDYSEGELVIMSCFVFMLMLTSFTVNGASLFVYISTKALHTPTDILFIAVLFDAFVATIGSPISFIHSLLRIPMGRTFCSIEASLVYFTGELYFLYAD